MPHRDPSGRWAGGRRLRAGRREATEALTVPAGEGLGRGWPKGCPEGVGWKLPSLSETPFHVLGLQTPPPHTPAQGTPIFPAGWAWGH